MRIDPCAQSGEQDAPPGQSLHRSIIPVRSWNARPHANQWCGC